MAIRAPDRAKRQGSGALRQQLTILHILHLLHILHILYSLPSLHSLLGLLGLHSLHLALSCINWFLGHFGPPWITLVHIAQ